MAKKNKKSIAAAPAELPSRDVSGIACDLITDMIDRQNVIIAQQDALIKSLRDERDCQQRHVDVAFSMEFERERRHHWDLLTRGALEKLITLAMDLAPTIANNFAGKVVLPERAVTKISIVQEYLKTRDAGGFMTTEQANAMFGEFEQEEPYVCTKPGVLTFEQGKLLHELGKGLVSPSLLSDLCFGGKHEITPDQLIKLQSKAKLTFAQLAPLASLLNEYGK